MKVYNDAAADQFNNEVLEKCDNCSRTFNPEALVKHQKMCRKKVEATNVKNPDSNDGLNWKVDDNFKKPKALVCFICGRQFGTNSLDIHIKSCKKKWEAQQELKPANERKPLPQPPTQKSALEGGEHTDSKVNLYNEAAAEQFNNEVLERCEGCGRTFNPESLARHQKLCLKDKEAQQSPLVDKEKTGGLNWKVEAAPKKPKAFVCYVCGRQYGTASFGIHLR